MQRLLKYAKHTQGKNVEITENKCKLIIKQLEEIIDFKFNINLPNGHKLTYLNVITSILLIDEYSEYRAVLIYLLRENKLNEKGLLLHLLGVINQTRPGLSEESIRNARKSSLTSFETLPFFKDVNWNEDTIELKTKNGNIKVLRYDKFVKNEEIYKLIKTMRFTNYCHATVDYMKNYYKDDYIITSELPLLLSDTYHYHSYLSTSEGIIDISNNMLYEEEEFNKVFEPNEILRIKSTELQKQYKRLLQEERIIDDGSVSPVLSLALANKIRGIK